jgi:antitoxin MazE
MAKTTALKIVPIGNSRGIRIPKDILVKYRLEDAAVLELRADGVLLRAAQDRRMSWAETYAATAAETAAAERKGPKSEWAVFDTTLADGLDGSTW